MTTFQFNSRNIIICFVIFIAIIIVGRNILSYLSKNNYNKLYKKITYVIMIILLVVSITITSLSLVFSPQIYKGTVIKIEDKGRSKFQLVNDFYITIQISNEKQIQFTTPYFSSIKIEKKLKSLKEGDYCEIKCNRFFTMYQIETNEKVD